MRRSDGKETLDRILDAGVEIFRQEGIYGVTAYAIGKRLDRAPNGVSYYFKTVEDLREQVLRRGFERNDVRAIAQLILMDHPLIAGWSDRKRRVMMAQAAIAER